MSSTFGKNIKISIWGQSHSEAIGITVDGLPAGIEINETELLAFMARRAPGQGAHTTARKEADTPVFLSGVVGGITCGAPLTAMIKNSDTRSKDYGNIIDTPRPGHADFTANVKYGGHQDVRGGGHFSGRLTAPLCIAGAICIGELKKLGITIKANIVSIGGKTGEYNELLKVIEEARANGDSVGGIIECRAEGVRAGLGNPMFDGLENRISQIMFGIPAVKGIEFGAGFAASEMLGSQNNDEFYADENGNIKTKTNNHGGILGGISSGMPIEFRVAFKPTPSISKPQQSVSLSERTNAELQINGRHDPCIVPRALPCVEAALAIVLYDEILESKI